MATSQSIAQLIREMASSQADIALRRGDVTAGMIRGLSQIPANIYSAKQDLEDRDLQRSSLQRAGELQGIQLDQAKKQMAMQAEIQQAVSTIADPIERLAVTNQLVSQKYPEELQAFQAVVAKTLEPLKTGNPQAYHEAYGRITGNLTEFNPTDPVLERQLKVFEARDKQADAAMQERARIDEEKRKLTEAGLDRRQTTQLKATAEQKELDRQARLKAAGIRKSNKTAATNLQRERLKKSIKDKKDKRVDAVEKEYKYSNSPAALGKANAMSEQELQQRKQQIQNDFENDMTSAGFDVKPFSYGEQPAVTSSQPEITATGPGGKKIKLVNGQWVPAN